MLASVFEECSSHSWSSKIKAGPSIFARRTSVRASTTLARVVPKSLCAPQCFDFKSYFFVWWESWAKQTDYLARANRGRERGKLAPLPAVRLIDLTKFSDPGGGTEAGGGSKRPHNRRGIIVPFKRGVSSPSALPKYMAAVMCRQNIKSAGDECSHCSSRVQVGRVKYDASPNLSPRSLESALAGLSQQEK